MVFNRKLGAAAGVVHTAECMWSGLQHAHNGQGHLKAVIVSDVRWKPPRPGCIKINSDGAASREEDWAAAAGVIRDSEGDWVADFQRFVGIGSH